MPTLRLSPRALAVAIAVALMAGVLGVVAVGGGSGSGDLAVTAPTTKPPRPASAVARAIVTARTAWLPPSTTTGVAAPLVAGSATAGDAGGTTESTARSSTASRPTTTAAPSGSAAAGPPPASSSATSPPNTDTPSSGPPPAPVTGPTGTDAALAARVVSDHNRIRAERGLPPLQRSSCLDGVASAWALHVAMVGTVDHNPLAPAQADRCTAWREVGENVGYDGSIEAVEAAWMSSGEHAANILDPGFTQIGVGVVRHEGLLWVVVNFVG